MKKDTPSAPQPGGHADETRKREYPFFRGDCSSPAEHFHLAVENRDLEKKVSTLSRRLSKVLGAAKRVRDSLKAKVRDLESSVLSLGRRVEYLEAVLLSTDAAIIVADTAGEIRIFNRGAESIFEIDAETAIGDNLFRIVQERTAKDEARRNERKLMDMLVLSRSISNMRIEFVGAEGKITPCLFTLNFVVDARGNRDAIVAVIKDNSEVEKLTRTDELTGLANRRHLLHVAQREYARMQRGQYEAISMLFFDVDNFGRFNKEYGHQVGDQVLRTVGEVTNQQARWLDTAGKYGGEEFVVVMPGSDEEGAAKLAERIRAAIESAMVPTKDHGALSVTVSVGIQTHRGTADHDEGVASLIREANVAMLVAKLQGKNRILRYESEHTRILQKYEEAQKAE